MIKTFEQYNEMDPYGEEDWGNEEFKSGDLIKCKKSRRSEYSEELIKGRIYKIGSMYMDKIYIYDKHNSWLITIFRKDKIKEYFDKI